MYKLVGKLWNDKKIDIISNDIKLLDVINNFIENVINKDKRYYSKLSTYNFDNETLKYLM